MRPINKLKILNDPIYGFISIPNALIFDLIEDPIFQRLRRISQMGLSYLVYPGAHHTRFQHALGCMHLITKAVNVLRSKGVEISDEESTALQAAILLHDIGHGPFSHAIENSLVKGVHHEDLSLHFMQQLNKKYHGALEMAIAIFTNQYPRKFLRQLIASQLDMDRLDYLRRDSFFTGVTEGVVNAERLISMLHVKDDSLVVEEKGIYSIEKFIIARRLMYWQVYLHKTSFAAEQILVKILNRARFLSTKSTALTSNIHLDFFLKENFEANAITPSALQHFEALDDTDILAALKQWQNHDDFVLAKLSNMLVNRKLPHIHFSNEKPDEKILNDLVGAFSKQHNVDLNTAKNFVFSGIVAHQAYNNLSDPIKILSKDGTLMDVAKASDQLNINALTTKVEKYFICHPKS